MGSLKLYTLLFVVINGSLQAEEQKVDVRTNGKKVRVYLRCAVPESGLELDVRNDVGTDRTFDIKIRGAGDVLFARRDMRCKHFAISHAANQPACARYIFESVEDDAQVETLSQSVRDLK